MGSLLGRVAPGFAGKLNLLIDLFILLVAFVMATLIAEPDATLRSSAPVWLGLLAVTVFVVTATALRHYDPWSNRSALDDAALVTVLALAVCTVLELVRFFAPASVPLPSVGHFLVLFWPATLAVRLFAIRSLAMHENPLDGVLVVGTGPLARATAEDLERSRAPREVLGFLSFPSDTAPARVGSRYLGPWSELSQRLAKMAVSEVYVAGDPARDREAVQSVVRTCETMGVPFALPACTLRLDRARAPSIVRDGYLHYLTVDFKPSQIALKRLFDIVASAIALWLLAPVLLAIGLLIKLTSKGPIFFRQTRVGLHGRKFHMLKFRSMVVNAESLRASLEGRNEQSGPVFKIKKDPRVTPVGRFLRRYSLDEFPQLINVLRGDMSVVGPRPPLPGEVAQYEAWQRRRLSVRPGLTCLWQVSGRNQLSFEEWMYLDMRYIDHWSLRTDLNLILKTIPVVITGHGAS
jgi:exopolysaccharide biosynthesis polyprenyl glycosylphosphotransferase